MRTIKRRKVIREDGNRTKRTGGAKNTPPQQAPTETRTPFNTCQKYSEFELLLTNTKLEPDKLLKPHYNIEITSENTLDILMQWANASLDLSNHIASNNPSQSQYVAPVPKIIEETEAKADTNDTTLIGYIGSHKKEFENLRANIIIGSITDDEIIEFIVSRLGCDQLINKNSFGNPCNNPNSTHKYADFVRLIASAPFDEIKVKGALHELCKNECENWDSFYHIFKAMGLYTLGPDSRNKIFNKFVTLFGAYLILGAHFYLKTPDSGATFKPFKIDLVIEWFDNIGTLQNDTTERVKSVSWTKVVTARKPWLKWFGYSTKGDNMAYDKFTPEEILDALKIRFPKQPNYTFDQSPVADMQIAKVDAANPEGAWMGGKWRRTKRNNIRHDSNPIVSKKKLTKKNNENYQ